MELLVCLVIASVSYAQEIRYDRGDRRDPMIPLIGPGGMVQKIPSGDFNVEGIIYDPPAGSLVLINGEFYKAGDTLHNATLISIFKDRIILRAEDEEKTLWIREEVLNEGEKKDDQKSEGEKKHKP